MTQELMPSHIVGRGSINVPSEKTLLLHSKSKPATIVLLKRNMEAITDQQSILMKILSQVRGEPGVQPRGRKFEKDAKCVATSSSLQEV
jgi:hypothetical protein